MNRARLLSLTFLLLSCCVFSSCTSGSSSDDSDGGNNVTSNPLLSEATLAATSNQDGFLTFNFTIGPAVSAFQLLTFPGTNQIRLAELRDPRGLVSLDPLASVYQGPQNPTDTINVLRVPFTPDNLAPGTYSATYQLIEQFSQSPVADTTIVATLVTKQDDNLSGGTARVNFILVGPVAGAEEIRDSLESVLSKVRSVFSAADIDLDVEWIAAQGPDTLPNPREDQAFYDELTRSVRPYAANIVFGSEVVGLQSPNDQYTVNLGDAGAAVPSPRSVGAVSIFAVAGGDGRFNYTDEGGQQIHNDEIQLASEEVSQLIAHYLGLSHIVENDGGRTLSSDALSDTESCVTLVDCQIEKDIRANLMFPFPILISGTDMDSYKRVDLTEQQKALLQRSVLVD